MSDQPYRFTWCPVHRASHAARLSVLFPLMGLEEADKEKAEARTLSACTLLLKRWRLRLNELREAGWEPLQGKGFQVARNCWPGGMGGLDPDSARRPGGAKTSRLCRLDPCPWCWGRRAERVYRAAASARGPRRGGYGTRVLSLLNTELFPFGADLPGWLTFLSGQARWLAGANDVLGACTSVAAYPLISGGEEAGWRLQSRLLAVLPPGGRLRVCPLGRDKLADGRRPVTDWSLLGTREGEEPTDGALLTHVSRVCRYPIPFMKADPALVVEALRARRGLRLAELVGAFRGAQEPPPPGQGGPQEVAQEDTP